MSDATRRDAPWMMRTYSGHSTAAASNALYRTNLAKGQTGLSIAFDLPTQTGYDPDSEWARGEVGKVGVPVAHLGHMRTLLDGIPPGEMNTSMTINATAAWLLALYVVNAEEQGVAASALRGTTQNDIVKEYLSRGTYIFPPEPSRRLIVDMIAWCSEHAPLWNPINVCSYHLQEAGATPVQEIAYALATAIGVLDAVRDSGQVPDHRFERVFASISFFVNAGIRFVEEICKLRAMAELWDRIGLERYGVADPRPAASGTGSRSTRSASPRPNRRTTCSGSCSRCSASRCRSGRGRARSSCRPGTRRSGSRRRGISSGRCGCNRCSPTKPICSSTATCSTVRRSSSRPRPSCVEAAHAELDDVLALGGAFAAVDVLKSRLVTSMAERTRRIESGEQTVVGVNAFTETDRLTARRRGGDPHRRPGGRGRDGRRRRRLAGVARPGRGRRRPRRAAPGRRRPDNVMPATIALARAGGTTGEWGALMREVFGEYRAPTGVAAVARRIVRAGRRRRQGADDAGRPATAAGRQARPRRALERRRADRRRRPRRRHGGDLLRDPARRSSRSRRRHATRIPT